MTAPERRPGLLLLTGMLVAPQLCCWLLLRRGYARSLRTAAFSYTIVTTAVPAIGSLG